MQRAGGLAQRGRKARLALAFAGCAAVALAAVAGAQLYPPLERDPLTIPLRPTGSFGEYRGGHFHAGLDFSTEERVGIPVIATAPGRIVRLRASGVGYGRSVYLQSEDGRLMVFGHLDAFDEPFASYVSGVQDSSGQYEQDLWPDSTRFAVTAGQRLGWSGRSGTGPPHLHFEIRRGDIAINPLFAGLSVADSTTPVIRRVTFEPLDDQSTVEGGVAPLALELGGAGTARVKVRGRVRAIVEAVDARANGRLTMAPWQVTTDGVDASVTCRFDSVSWAEGMSEVDYVYDRGRATGAGSTSIVLWAPPAFRPRVLAGGTAPSEEAGTLVVRPGDSERVLRITARDAAGNETMREVAIVPDAAPPRLGKVEAAWFEPHAQALPTGRPERMELEVGDFAPNLPSASMIASDDVRFTSLPAGFLRVEVTGARWRGARPHALSLAGHHPLEIGARPTAILRPLSLPHDEALRIAGPGPPFWSAYTRRLRLIAARDGGSDGLRGFRWRIPAGALFEPATWVATTAPVGAKHGELSSVGPMFTLAPQNHPLRASIEVELDVPARRADPRLGVYRDGGDGWEFVRARHDSSAHRFVAETRRLGSFALFRDVRAPRIAKRKAPSAPVQGPYPRWALETVLEEQGSGVDVRATAFEVDGRRVPSEWDAEERTLRWRPLHPLAAGRHRFRVIATDRAGNVARAEGTFVID